MALTIKEIELVNLGASIAAGCKPCTSYHIKKLKEANASDEEINNSIKTSVSIKDLTKTEMEKHALNDLGATTNNNARKENLYTDRINVLVSIGSSFAINCVSLLDYYLELSESLQISPADLNKIFKAVKLIKMKAALYVDKIAIIFDQAKTDVNVDSSDDCGCSESTSKVQNNPMSKGDNGCC